MVDTSIDIDINDEKAIDSELEIHYESIFALEKELREYPKRGRKYHRAYAKAIRDVNDITLEAKIIIAEVTEELINKAEKDGKGIPHSARGELKNTKVPLDMRYKLIFRKLNKATERKDFLKGLVEAWSSKGYRLGELAELSKRLLFNEPRTYVENLKEFTYKSPDAKLSELEGKLNVEFPQ